MPRPANVQRRVIRGTLPGGEVWSTGFWTANGAPENYNQLSADTFYTNVSNGASSVVGILAANLWPAGTVFTGVDLYVYGPAGQGAVAKYSKDGNIAGTVAVVTPNQTAIVASLRTDLATARGRGRMYFPANGGTLTAGGLFQSTGAQGLSTAVAALLGPLDAVIVSEADGASRLVTQVRVDQRPDVQRRRADKQVRGNVYTTSVV